MKVLWLSSANTLSDEKGDRAYNGKGWIASLQEAVCSTGKDIELAVAFLSSEGDSPVSRLDKDGVTYYRIRKRSPGGVKKLIGNWTGFFAENYDSEIKHIADDFSPDIIHLFGCESKLASAIVSISGIPVITHIQGILNECLESFYPPHIKNSDFILPQTFFNEAVLMNGFIHLRKDYMRRARKEKKYLSALRFAMGRTDWDRQKTSAYSNAEYFHVDEVLREEFYAAAGLWSVRDGNSGKPRILSTISETPYKGLDVIMDCARILKSEGTDVEWNVAGIPSGSHLAEVFGHKYGIDCGTYGIRLCGVATPAQLVSLMLASDMFVHPSYIDNSPNSVCEAQMTGMPVIASATGGVPTLVRDGDTGLLFPPGDADALAGRILQIAAAPRLAVRLGKQAAETAARRHDRTRIVSDLMAAYRQSVADYSRI